jgi:FKBP-type peptidyl-prolyl cis-trans isomerase
MSGRVALVVASGALLVLLSGCGGGTGTLEIKDLQVGSGDEAIPGTTLKVHYTGWLHGNGKRGSKFESSKDGGTPIDFKLGAGEVIQGWDDGIRGMKVGGKRLLVIPPEMGYGAQGSPPTIPANATLEFEVELLGVSR